MSRAFTILLWTLALLVLVSEGKDRDKKFDERKVIFAVEDDKINWYEAINRWPDGKKRLATIRNIEEQNDILAILRRYGYDKESFWVAGTYGGSTSHSLDWMVIDKNNKEHFQKMVFTHWLPSEPKMTPTNRCVILSPPDAQWKMENCRTKKYRYISEQDIVNEDQ